MLVGNRRNPYVPKYKIFGDDVIFKVVKAGEPQYFPDAQNAELLTEKFGVPRHDAPDNRFVIREGVHSCVSLPLQAGTETVGVMFINYRTAQEFGTEQKDLIESFSNLAAIAIHNSRLWKLQNNQLAALKEIIDVIGAENPLEPILNRRYRYFLPAMEPSAGSLKMASIWSINPRWRVRVHKPHQMRRPSGWLQRVSPGM